MKKLIIILFLLIGTVTQGQLLGVIASSGGDAIIDIYPQDNAASITTEVNATTGWGVVNTSLASVDVGTSAPYHGTYSIKGTSTSDVAYSRVFFGFPVIGGQQYRIKIWAKRGAVGIGQRFRDWNNISTPIVTIDSTTWTEYIFLTTASTTGTGEIRVYTTDSSDTTIGSTVYIDAITIEEI